MIDRALTCAADFADRHDRAIGIAAAVWLALWWGFAHPAIDRRCEAKRLDPPTQPDP